MADMMLLVDAAVTVPVNLFPLTDDADFKTRETTVAYNAAGMELLWNFQTAAGVTTQTAVTPTTGGTYDWTHIGGGNYKVAIPASGGVSINNDTEGFGWFTGVADGVLPWKGPVIQFSPANVVNSLVNGTDLLDTNAAQVGGTSQTGVVLSQIVEDTEDIQARLPPSLTGDGNMKADAVAISGDATAADNAERMFDGSGYGTVLLRTTIGTVNTQTDLTLDVSTGNTSNLLGSTIIIRDVSVPANFMRGEVTSSDGSSVVFSLNGATATFTIVPGDIVEFIASEPNYVRTTAIKTRTDRIPDLPAGSANGLFIAGSNAATTVNFTGNLSGSVGSVTGSVGSVTGAVGSVTGNVGGNVTGSVGSVTGNVGGNVTGSVGSVIGNVLIADGYLTAAKFDAGIFFDPGTQTVLVGAVEPAVLAQFVNDDTGEVAASANSVAALSKADVSALSTSTQVAALLTTALTESYAANGAAPTLTQAMMAVHQMLMQFTISGTSYTVKKLDGSTTAFVVTLDDDTSPTGVSRA